MNYQSEGFNILTSRRPFYLLKLLRKYPRIIYSDIDTIWRKDPRPYFKGNHDYWTQLDGFLDGRPYFHGYIPFMCTGFMAFRATPLTMNLLKKWYNEIKTDSQNKQDQSVFQSLAFKYSANFGALPIKFFPSGRTYFEAMSDEIRNEVVILHNNFINGKELKIKRFKKFNLWSPNSCIARKQPIRILEHETNHNEMHVMCHKDDQSIGMKTTVFPGKIFLLEENLKRSFEAGVNIFKNDYMEYFYYANKHWKNPL